MLILATGSSSSRCSNKLLTIIRLSELSEQERQTRAVEKVTLDLAIVVSHGLRCQGNMPSDL